MHNVMPSSLWSQQVLGTINPQLMMSLYYSTDTSSLEPSITPTAALSCSHTAAVASVMSSLITALIVVGISIATFRIYYAKKSHSIASESKDCAGATDAVVYDVVNERSEYRAAAVSVIQNEACGESDVPVSMEQNEAYGVSIVQDKDNTNDCH